MRARLERRWHTTTGPALGEARFRPGGLVRR